MPEKPKSTCDKSKFPWLSCVHIINPYATALAFSKAGYFAGAASAAEIRSAAIKASVKFNDVYNGKTDFDAACIQHPMKFKAMQDKFVNVIRNAFPVRLSNDAPYPHFLAHKSWLSSAVAHFISNFHGLFTSSKRMAFDEICV